MLIFGTYRDTDLSRSDPLADALADFRRDRALERIALKGLNETELGELVDNTN